MTSGIEDRLRDAFAAGAELVSAEQLRPTQDVGLSRVSGRPRRRLRVLPLLAAVSIAAVVGVAAVVPALVGHPAAPAPGNAADPGFSTVVDRLAQRVEQPGKYWRSEMETITWGRVQKQTYKSEARVKRVWWATPGGPVWETTPLFTRPATPADEKKWRKAGSPELCGTTVGCDGAQIRHGTTEYYFSKTFELSVPLTGREILNLPQDPDALKAVILRLWSPQRDAERRGEIKYRNAASDSDRLWWTGEALLTQAPAPPKVRAAVLRILADLPGASLVDQAKDVDGRSGIAIVRKSDRDPVEKQIIIDRTTGDVLGTLDVALPDTRMDKAGWRAGDLFSAGLMRKLGRTDEGPVLPKGCQPKAEAICDTFH